MHRRRRLSTKPLIVLAMIVVSILALVFLFPRSNLQNDEGAAQEYYDNNNNLFKGDLGLLGENARAVTMVAYYDNMPVFWLSVSGYVYEKWVVVPSAIFYVSTPSGPVDLSAMEKVSTKLFLNADPDKSEENREELGEIKLQDAGTGFIVVERINPIFTASGSAYVMGRYDKLEVGDFIYLTDQENSALTIKASMVSRLFSRDGKNLASLQGNFSSEEWGGLVFALRKGKPELVGIFGVLGEPVFGSDELLVHFLDINQIIEEIKKLQ